MNNNFSALIFSDSYESATNELTKNRTLASIPIAGRFRTIDFILSALVNANVSNVAVITKSNYASLGDHLSGGMHWDLNHRNSGLRVLSPFFKTENNNEAFMARGRLDALRSVQLHIKSIKQDYVVLANANIIANIDFNEVFKNHLLSGADITAVYSNIVSTSKRNLSLSVDKNQRINEITYATKQGEKQNISLSVYVMKRDFLLNVIATADAHDHYSFEKYALINQTENFVINGYEHKGYASIIRSVKDYYDTNMQLLQSDLRKEVFLNERPVITRPMDTVPTLYQFNAHIENSLIADGCKIDGTVKNSIIFRNVRVETGVVIENSIVMQNSVIRKNSVVKNVILDKNCEIFEYKTLIGDKQYPYVITKGTTI